MAENQSKPAGQAASPGEAPLGTSPAPRPTPAIAAEPSFVRRVLDDLFKPQPKPPKKKDKDAPKGDTTREVVETVVFVVVLVLMLKAFVAEAFIIPTGSMATTLLGYHRDATCDKCGHHFEVNASADAEEFHWFQTGPATSGVCPNCRNIQELSASITGGDKVLVLKPQYDFGWPQRWDVIVFKFPGSGSEDGPRRGGPQENFSAKNYIKRLWGLPGDKLSIWHGDVYLIKLVDGKVERTMLRKPRLKVLEMRRLVNDNNLQAIDLKGTLPPHWADEGEGDGWSKGEGLTEFKLASSAEERRLRFRNFVRPAPLPPGALRLIGSSLKQMESALTEAERERLPGTSGFVRILSPLVNQLQALDQITLLPVATKTEELQALCRRVDATLKEAEAVLPTLSKPGDNRDENPLGVSSPKDTLRSELTKVRDSLKEVQDQWKLALDTAQQAQLVTDFLGYNAAISGDPNGYYFPRELGGGHEPHWVKDLMLDCEVEITQPGGEFTVELNAGVDVHRATFDLTTGVCTLKVLRFSEDPNGKEIATKQAPTSLKGTGRHLLQFANFDDRLTLWIDRSSAFGDGLDFAGPSAEERGPRAGDVKPISIIGKGAGLAVRRLQVWRDIYYTRSPRDTAEYEDLRFVDRSALSMANFLSIGGKDQALPPAGQVDRWSGFGRQKPWYYPMGKRKDGMNIDIPDPEEPDGPPLGADEYFALGDNSTRSSDSRDWGAVPGRLLLGKAVFVYWPIPRRFGPIW